MSGEPQKKRTKSKKKEKKEKHHSVCDEIFRKGYVTECYNKSFLPMSDRKYLIEINEEKKKTEEND